MKPDSGYAEEQSSRDTHSSRENRSALQRNIYIPPSTCVERAIKRWIWIEKFLCIRFFVNFWFNFYFFFFFFLFFCYASDAPSTSILSFYFCCFLLCVSLFDLYNFEISLFVYSIAGSGEKQMIPASRVAFWQASEAWIGVPVGGKEPRFVLERHGQLA